ncbi:hypothetical protein EDD85DRAFT_146630 [Armillaria nabsnona]|nr:hypothetical protein EDD85DRAFT_146630 [Armillaria nabsnona]
MATWEYEQVERWERTLHTNNLGPGLLTICIVPKLLERAPKHSAIPRLVIVASYVHYGTTVEKDVITGLSILAKLPDKNYCTKEVVNHRYFGSKRS